MDSYEWTDADSYTHIADRTPAPYPGNGVAARNLEILRLAERVRYLEGLLRTPKPIPHVSVPRDKVISLMEAGKEKLAGMVAELEDILAGRGDIRKAYPVFDQKIATLEQENATLRADNLSLVNHLKTEGVRATSLRLELETVKVENRRLIDDLAAVQKREAELYENFDKMHTRAMRAERDLAAAIKTGEEQAEKIAFLEEGRRLDKHDNAAWAALCAAKEARLSRLDALLSSEEVPAYAMEQLDSPNCAWASVDRPGAGPEICSVIWFWRWLRDILRGPIDDPVPEKEPNAEEQRSAFWRLIDAYSVSKEDAQKVAREIAEEMAETHAWSKPEGVKFYPRHAKDCPLADAATGVYRTAMSALNERDVPLSDVLARQMVGEMDRQADKADAELGRSLVAILSGEKRESEGAVETLERILRERNMYKGDAEVLGKKSVEDNGLAAENAALRADSDTMKERANIALRELLGDESLVPLDALSAVTAVAMRGRGVAAENKRLAQRNREGRDAEEQNAALLEILREVEFEGEGDTCPLCGFSNPKYRPESPGHISDCRLGLALAGKGAEPGVVVAASPGSLVAEHAKESGPQPWFAGLSMEEVHQRILLGQAPGSGQPGVGVLVPEGFLNWVVSAKRPPEQPHPEVRSVGEGAAGGAFRSTYREVVPGIVTIRDIRIRVPFDLDIEFMELSGRLFWRLVHAFPSEEPQGE